MYLTYRPGDPFSAWPAHWSHPDFGWAWLAEEPHAIVSQATVDRASVRMVDALQNLFDEVVALGVLAAHPRLVLIHDWRSIKIAEPGALERWLERSQRPGHPFKSVAAVYVALRAGSVVRATLQAASLALSMRTGMSAIRLIEDPAAPLATRGVKAPPGGVLERIRGGKQPAR